MPTVPNTRFLALAYGTATVPKVDKITGPGNAYVASAATACAPPMVKARVTPAT